MFTLLVQWKSQVRPTQVWQFLTITPLNVQHLLSKGAIASLWFDLEIDLQSVSFQRVKCVENIFFQLPAPAFVWANFDFRRFPANCWQIRVSLPWITSVWKDELLNGRDTYGVWKGAKWGGIYFGSLIKKILPHFCPLSVQLSNHTERHINQGSVPEHHHYSWNGARILHSPSTGHS